MEHKLGVEDVRNASLVAASTLTVLWLSLEVYAAVSYNVTFARPEDLHFGLSGVWGLYAGALLAIGFYARARLARLMSLVLFGITLIKMAAHDLWLLDTLQRLIGFVGIGALLLACSLMYHRFRDWVLAEDAARQVPAAPPTGR